MDIFAELEKLRMEHRVIEDCWFSCPKSGECCNDNEGEDCNCGADKHNETLDRIIDEMKKPIYCVVTATKIVPICK